MRPLNIISYTCASKQPSLRNRPPDKLCHCATDMQKTTGILSHTFFKQAWYIW